MEADHGSSAEGSQFVRSSNMPLPADGSSSPFGSVASVMSRASEEIQAAEPDPAGLEAPERSEASAMQWQASWFPGTHAGPAEDNGNDGEPAEPAQLAQSSG